jgi:hypothetical protein
LNLADRVTGRIYIRFESGQLKWIDSEPFASVDHDNDERAALAIAAPQIFEPIDRHADEVSDDGRRRLVRHGHLPSARS